MNLSQPYYIEPRKGDAHLNLDGVWELGYASEQVEPEQVEYSMNANVPGSVFWHLYEAGKLPNPYEYMNNKLFAWVDDVAWYYRRTFTLDKPVSGQAILCFDGACYFTRVWLNGVLLGEHEGMFGGPYCQVAELLKVGENTLVAEVRACNYKNPDYTPRNSKGIKPFPIIPWNLMREDSCLDGDFNVIGLWRGVRIEFLNPVHLGRPHIYTESIDGNTAKLHFEVEVSDPKVDELKALVSDSTRGWTNFTFSFRDGNPGAKQANTYGILVEMTERGTGNKVYSKVEPFTPYDWENITELRKFDECHHYQREITLENAKLWMPATMGNPELYDIHVALFDGETQLDEQDFGFGVRTVTRTYSAGDKFRTRWDKFQFVINGKNVFINGVNWMPIDHFLILKREEYRWSLETAKAMGVMLIRVWSGGGIPENDDFYELCDELGIMVWQDNFIANTDSDGWNHDVLLNQVCMNLFRMRNHPSLVIHCGGNEFNPYSLGNIASMSVIENAIQDIDPSREWVRTTPDRGSAHIYKDLEPSWYRYMTKQLPFLAESGIHSFPTMKALEKVISKEEISRPLSNIFTKEFETGNPELRNHFVEFIPERIPRMLSRASAINDIRGISLVDLVEATQMASVEFYQVMIESLRENYPITTGIMPWVYRRPSVAVGVQLMDGLGNPIAPFYAVRNAYQPLSVSLAMEHMTLRPNEELPLTACILNGNDESIPMLKLRLEIYDPELNLLEVRQKDVSVRSGEPVQKLDFGSLTMTEAFRDKFFFLRLTLENEHGIVARKFYWPRCLSLLEDDAIFTERRAQPMPNLTISDKPWLKHQVAECGNAKLSLKLISEGMDAHRQWAEVELCNVGTKPAFPVVLDGHELPSLVSDNYFVLNAGEKRSLRIEFFRKNGESVHTLEASAWNADTQTLSL